MGQVRHPTGVRLVASARQALMVLLLVSGAVAAATPTAGQPWAWR